jgi:hypothetical protein
MSYATFGIVMAKAMTYYKLIFHSMDMKFSRSYCYRMKLSNHRKSDELPSRIVALIHSLIAVIVGYFCLFGLLNDLWVSEIIPFITAYLYYDWLKAIEKWDRRGIGDRLHVDGDVLAHPIGVLFHHIVTILFLNGFLIMTNYDATFTFCLGELPVFLINLNWLLHLFGAQETRLFRLISNFTVLTYFFCRVVLFAISFIFCGLPRISLFHLSTYVALPLLALVFLLNIIWFYKLANRDMPIVSQRLFKKGLLFMKKLAPILLSRRNRT